jgi:trehalose 2-sulfotransferase
MESLWTVAGDIRATNRSGSTRTKLRFHRGLIFVIASDAAVCSYVIATSPRSGSNLLCESLAQTGIAGKPAELGLKYRGSVPHDEYVRTRLRDFATDNGVSGVKLFWGQLQLLVRECHPPSDSDGLLDRFFPRAKYIQLVRRDRRGQAISLYRALATNEFRRRSGVVNRQITGVDPEFDGHAIRRLEDDLDRQEAAWRECFRRRRIVPLVLEYESLVSHRSEEVARVLGFIGQNPAAAFTIPEPRLIRQADSTTAQWRRLMDAEDAIATDSK